MASPSSLFLYLITGLLRSGSNSFIRNTYSGSPRFAVFWPKLSARNSFRCNTYRIHRRNPFRRNTYKKEREGCASR
jgi:hypothetical protein